MITILITSILTASVTLLSVHLTNISHRNREVEDFKRKEIVRTSVLVQEKAEELYFLFSRWSTEASSVYLTFIPVLTGKIKEKDAWDIANKNKYTDNGTYQKIDMLARIYFPELSKQLKKVHDARDKCSSFISSTDSSLIPEFLKSQEFFDKESLTFLNYLSEIAKKQLKTSIS